MCVHEFIWFFILIMHFRYNESIINMYICTYIHMYSNRKKNVFVFFPFFLYCQNSSNSILERCMHFNRIESVCNAFFSILFLLYCYYVAIPYMDNCFMLLLLSGYFFNFLTIKIKKFRKCQKVLKMYLHLIYTIFFLPKLVL